MPAIYGSLDRLNAIYDVFTSQGNKTLDTGEVDAIAGFYNGLKPDSKAKIEDRLAEIYKTSKFEKGQKARFRDLLRGAGLSIDKTEGQTGSTADAVLSMSKTEQFEKLKDLESQGIVFETSFDSIFRDAKARIATKMKSIQAALDKKYKNDDSYSLGDEELQAIFREGSDDVDQKDCLGYCIRLGIYADGHDIDRMYFFNLNGEYLGDEYRGE